MSTWRFKKQKRGLGSSAHTHTSSSPATTQVFLFAEPSDVSVPLLCGEMVQREDDVTVCLLIKAPIYPPVRGAVKRSRQSFHSEHGKTGPDQRSRSKQIWTQTDAGCKKGVSSSDTNKKRFTLQKLYKQAPPSGVCVCACV